MALQKKYHLIEAVVAVFEKMDEPLFLIISNEIVIAFSKEESSSYERLSLINSIHHLIEKAPEIRRAIEKAFMKGNPDCHGPLKGEASTF